MNPVTPRLDAPLVTIAEDQPEFEPVKVAVVVDPSFPTNVRRVQLKGDTHLTTLHMNAVVMAFKPTPEEMQRIFDGVEVYISLLTFGKPQQAIYVDVGPEACAERYSIGTT